MKVLVQAKAQTNIAFRAGRDNRRERTLDYVAGSVLRGGLAATHTRMRAGQQEEFSEFFLKGRIIFGNLYPASFSHPNSVQNPLDDQRSPVHPLPRTASSCKRFGGFAFHAKEEDDQRHGVCDSLIAWAVFALSKGKNNACLDQLRCCSCGEPMDFFSGFCRRGRQAAQWGTGKVMKGIFTRTGINRSLGTAAEGILYSREFLRAGSLFCGEWMIDDDLAQSFQAFVDDAVEIGDLRVGHNRTRGLGRLAIPKGLIETTTDSPEQVECRARMFNAALRRVVQEHHVEAAHDFYLPVTLTADTIVPDPAGRYRLQIDGSVLQAEWGISGAELIYCNAVQRRVCGWNDLSGLPKADEWAIAMGSVFLFGLSTEPDWESLAEVQSRGIGARRTEGFGAVRIAGEFHLEVNGI